VPAHETNDWDLVKNNFPEQDAIVPMLRVTAIKLSAVGAGHARDEGATNLNRTAKMSRARPAPTVSWFLAERGNQARKLFLA